ncbi:hypothetical protein LOK49_LG14G01202 [Camellia lanceoleosa]|uniref:Uncharacterized protein n=1 Tax=Camellia lanceoleosa TaxID=1840588 RepID=A0ACC0FB91_9ERIC|nr:hypothetical protein LOK49_LG14G01202 [Camellia lanceoleosa]
MAANMKISVLHLTTRDRLITDSMSIVDGNWTRSNTTRVDCMKEVSILGFESIDEALKTFHFFDGLNHPNLPTVYGLEEAGDGDGSKAHVIIDRLPPVRVKKWLNHKSGKWVMWSLNSSGDQFLEMEEKHQQLFKCISEAIFYLHQRGKSHGNLLNGIMISDPSSDHIQIKLWNFDMTLVASQKILADLRKLVELVVNKHSTNIVINGKYPKQPHALKSFYDLCDQFDSFDMAEKRSKFLLILENFSEQDADSFEEYMILDPEVEEGGGGGGGGGHGKKRKKKQLEKVYVMLEMKDWKARIMNVPKLHSLVTLLTCREETKKYQSSGGV